MTLVRRPAMLLATAAVLVVALAMLTNVLPFRAIVDQGRQVEATRAELDALLTENRALASQVDALNTPAEIERLARDRLGYVMPGEAQYVVVDPDEPEPLPTEDFSADQSSSSTLPMVGLWDRVWSFLTGADLPG